MKTTPMSRLSAQDSAAVAVLVLLPVALFVVPWLIGQPLLPGDDLTQNYPLRALSGELLAHGHLPLWNAGNWSGTALLGGFNAGALFPGTLLFAVVSPLTAWVTNEIVTYVVCGVGLYALLRKQRLVPLAAALASLSFTFSGFMAAHLRHVGLVQGTSLIPWLLLAMEGLVSAGRRWAWWWLLLCVTGGLIVLSGEPRAISNAAIAAALYGGALVWRSPRRSKIVVGLVAAVPMIVALGAVQLLPGLAFVHTSQRGSIDYAFFAHGSLSPELLPLMLVPYLVGAYGTFHWLPTYIGGYNLPEITGYIGLLPLVALVTLPWWRPRIHAARLWAWVAMVGVGVVLALGGHTPLGHLLAGLPLYGGQRLQSRNLALVDLGLAGAFGWWVNAILARRPAALPDDSPRARRGHIEQALSLLPSVAVVVLLACAWLAAPSLQRFLAVPNIQPGLFDDLRPYFLGVLALACLVAFFAAFHRRLPAVARTALLVAIVVADLVMVTINQDPGFAETSILRPGSPDVARIVRVLRPGERVAVYDPNRRDGSIFGDMLTSDLNIVQGLVTVQGYASVLDARYESATGTHTRRLIRPSAIAGNIANQLDLRLLLVPPSYLSAAIARQGASGAGDPELEAALTAPHWVEAGRYGPYLAFANAQVLGRAWVVQPGARSPTGRRMAGAKVIRTTVSDGDLETDRVHSPNRAVLVRSVAYADGWSAQLHSSDGTTTSVPVRRLGLVQAVAIPEGVTTITWRFEPPGLKVGLWLTLLAGGGMTALAVVLLTSGILARRRRPIGFKAAEFGDTRGGGDRD